VKVLSDGVWSLLPTRSTISPDHAVVSGRAWPKRIEVLKGRRATLL